MDKRNIESTDDLIGIVDQLLNGDFDESDSCEDSMTDFSGDKAFNRLAEKIIQLKKQYKENFQYIMSLSRGELNVKPPRHNTFVAPYKQLQSELLHLTWQIDEVTKGDYNQQISFAGDISEAFNKMINALRKRQLQEVKERTEELKALNRMKDKLLSIIAHDLKTPFSALVGYSELLMEPTHDYQEEDFKEIAMIMNRSATQGHEILVNLLEWSRQQSGRIKIIPQTLCLKDIIHYNLEMVRLSALSKKVTLEASGVEKCQVYTDSAILNTILRNLISNAIKYTPEGGKISVGVKKDTGHYLISVKDTGVGIPEEDMDKLFCANTMHSTKGTNNENGTGLGLILCHEFIRMLQGKIWVESELGSGTTFAFTLPDMCQN